MLSAGGSQISFRCAPGDNVTLVAPRGAVTPMGTTPRIKSYKISAVFEIGMSEYDAAFVFMPLKEAQAYFNRAGDVTSIEVYGDDPDKVEGYRKLVNDAAGRPIFIVDWRQRNATFFNALQVERNVMFLILTLIILVAAFNIVSSMIMLVKDKGRDIAILRTMGATQGAIMRVFFNHRCEHRRRRHVCRLAAWNHDLRQCGIHPAIPVLDDKHGIILARALFPLAIAGRHGCRRNDGSGGDGARAFLPRYALSGVAGRASRSG